MNQHPLDASQDLLEKAASLLLQTTQSSSLNLAQSCSLIALQYKGENLKLYYPQNKSPLADYVLILSANNTTQANAMAEMMMQFLRRQKVAYKVEGLELSQWILIDVQDVLVHIFLPETRDLYQLDDLYSHITKIPLPQEFYSTPTVPENKSKNNFQDYF